MARFDSPLALVQACHTRDDHIARRALETLTEEAATDPWAARTVLQALLPGLARAARDHRDMVGGPAEPFGSVDELDQFLLCTAYERITEVAADFSRYRLRAVLNSTWYRLRIHARGHRRDHRRRLPLREAAAVTAGASRSDAEELATVLVDAVERRVLRPVDAGLVYTTRVVGHSPAEVAEDLDWQLGTVWRRRHRTEAVLVAEALGRRRPRGHHVAPARAPA